MSLTGSGVDFADRRLQRVAVTQVRALVQRSRTASPPRRVFLDERILGLTRPPAAAKGFTRSASSSRSRLHGGDTALERPAPLGLEPFADRRPAAGQFR